MWSAACIGACLLAVAACSGSPQQAVSPTEPLLQPAPLGAMSVARAAHQAALLADGSVLIVGGCAHPGCTSIQDSAEIYHPETRNFRRAAAMPEPRVSHVAVTLGDGNVLIAGGWTGERVTARAEVYLPAQSRFRSLEEMSAPRMGPIAALLADGRVLIAGGERAPRDPLASAEIFDPEAGAFSAVGSMQTPRTAHAAVLLADGRVLITGGNRGRGQVLRSAEIFDPASGEFRPAGEMAAPRHKHAAVLLADGRVLLVGGSDARDAHGRYATTEIYDPQTGRFSPGPALGSPRHKITHAVVALTSGEVLVAGGADRMELWRPGERSFQPLTGKPQGLREFATATVLSSGEVLVLGGYDERIRPSDAAWLVRRSP